MTFTQLYTDRLDEELGSDDQTELFTTARRKSAINRAQVEFVERTECLVKEFSIAVVDGTEEYDLEAGVTNFLRIAKAGPSLKMVDASSNVRYIEGPDDFPETSPPLLNRQNPGWRANPDGTPIGWYRRRNGGLLYLGLTPGPDIPTGETWTLLVPCVVKPTDMSAAGDEPFTVSGGTAPSSLSPWHQALVHHAAYLLEKLRKDPQRMEIQKRLFEEYVGRYWAQDRPKGSRMIQMVKDYRRHARRGGFRRYSINADSAV